jgi:SAM-dependent methyltransferase
MIRDLPRPAALQEPPRRSVLETIEPERLAGGYGRHDSRVMFSLRVQSLLRRQHHVLDVGAGSGSWFDRLPPWQARLCSLRGKCEVVYGCDPDPVVKRNQTVDYPSIVRIEDGLPYVDGGMDMVVAYAVLEHVQDPERFAAEVRRVLKPDGWFCAWTPNRHGYIGLGARLVPSRLHARLLRTTSPHDRRAEADVFPTVYRMNTRKALRRLFPGWLDATHAMPTPPGSYACGSPLLARLIAGWQRIAPDPVQTGLHVFMRKPTP